MSVRTYVTLSCLIAGAGLVLGGCTKKTDQSLPAPTPSTAQSSSAPQVGPEAGANVPADAEKPVAGVQTPALGSSMREAGSEISAKVAADVQKAVAEVQTQAQAMSLPDLKSIAVQYKDAIVAKKADLQKVMAQVKEIPLAEALGEKARTLKTEVQKIESSVRALTERFQVYYDQLKAKGADLSGLAI